MQLYTLWISSSLFDWNSLRQSHWLCCCFVANGFEMQNGNCNRSFKILLFSKFQINIHTKTHWMWRRIWYREYATIRTKWNVISIECGKKQNRNSEIGAVVCHTTKIAYSLDLSFQLKTIAKSHAIKLNCWKDCAAACINNPFDTFSPSTISCSGLNVEHIGSISCKMCLLTNNNFSWSISIAFILIRSSA